MSERRLAAIMFTDIVGYTSLMGKDEKKAFEFLKKSRRIQWRLIKKYKGRWLKEMGDGVLASFTSSIDAVMCAMSIQAAAEEMNIPLRIGIHQGDVIFEKKDVLGDGVNIASRIQSVATTNGIVISETVYKDIKNKDGIKYEYLGLKPLKGIDSKVGVYKVNSADNSVLDFKIDTGELVRPLGIETKTISAAIFIIVILAFALYYFLPKIIKPILEVDKSIAVLPFRNESPNQEMEYFCNSVTDEILKNLIAIADLSVKASFVVEKYKNQEIDLNVIRTELGVAFILVGSVRRIGDNIKITTQLIDTETGDYLWGELFEGKYTGEIFAFYSSIAKKVAGSLQAAMTPQEEERIDIIPAKEIAAYELSLRGHDIINKWRLTEKYTKDSSSLKLALNLFDQSLEIEPYNINALIGKGMAYQGEDNYDSALYYFEKLIELYPDHPYGYSGKGLFHWKYTNEPDSAYKYYSKAVDIAPNNIWVNFGLGQILIWMKNEVIRGLQYFQKAYELGGESTGAVNYHIGWVYFEIGDFPKAEEYYTKSFNISLDCKMINGLWNNFSLQRKNDEAFHFLDSICSISACELICDITRFYAYLNQKEFKQAEEYYNKAVNAGYNKSIDDRIDLAYLHKETGREKEAIEILESIIKRDEEILKDNATRRQLSFGNMRLAISYAILDNNEKALRYLSEFEKIEFISNWYWFDMIQIYPPFENLWDDSEFKAIVKRAQEKKAVLRSELREMEERGEIDL